MNLLATLLAPLLAPLAKLLGYAATLATGWLARGREQKHAQEMADAEAELDTAERTLAARDAGRDANIHRLRELREQRERRRK